MVQESDALIVSTTPSLLVHVVTDTLSEIPKILVPTMQKPRRNRLSKLEVTGTSITGVKHRNDAR